MIAIGSEDRWHLQLAQRWIVQYNFYINDQRWGRMFVRISPYLPFSARVCLNQHHWVANRTPPAILKHAVWSQSGDGITIQLKRRIPRNHTDDVVSKTDLNNHRMTNIGIGCSCKPACPAPLNYRHQG
jgi:hypothetical protein